MPIQYIGAPKKKAPELFVSPSTITLPGDYPAPVTPSKPPVSPGRGLKTETYIDPATGLPSTRFVPAEPSAPSIISRPVTTETTIPGQIRATKGRLTARQMAQELNIPIQTFLALNPGLSLEARIGLGQIINVGRPSAVAPTGAVQPDTTIRTPEAPPVAPTITATEAAQITGVPQPQRIPTAEELGIPKRLTAADIMAQITMPRATTAEDVLATPLGGLQAQVSARKGAEALAAGEAAVRETQARFETAGLGFSTMAVSAEGAARAKAMSQKMDIDESLTRFIVQQEEAGDKETAQRIKDIVKDAVSADKEVRSEAITALRGIGYEILPSGQVVPSLAMAREERLVTGEERAAVKEERKEELAERRIGISEERLRLAEAKAAEPPASEKLRQEMVAVGQNIKAALSSTKDPKTGTIVPPMIKRGTDGYISPEDYELIEDTWAANFPDKMGTFYQLFPTESYINPTRHPDFIKARRARFDPWAALLTPGG